MIPTLLAYLMITRGLGVSDKATDREMKAIFLFNRAYIRQSVSIRVTRDFSKIFALKHT